MSPAFLTTAIPLRRPCLSWGNGYMWSMFGKISTIAARSWGTLEGVVAIGYRRSSWRST